MTEFFDENNWQALPAESDCSHVSYRHLKKGYETPEPEERIQEECAKLRDNSISLLVTDRFQSPGDATASLQAHNDDSVELLEVPK